VCRLLEVLSSQHRGDQAYVQSLEIALQAAQAKLVSTCVFLCVCVLVCVSRHVFVNLCICVHAFLHMYLCECVYVHVRV